MLGVLIVMYMVQAEVVVEHVAADVVVVVVVGLMTSDSSIVFDVPSVNSAKPIVRGLLRLVKSL